MPDINHQPLVSVGIMAYNRPEGLRQTLDCITGQSYRNLQITVSNNCSTDPAVAEVLAEYAAKDSRIKVFTQSKNIGPGANFMFVLDQSIGEYYMWAADDDYWDSRFIESALDLFTANPDAVAAFCAVKEKESGQVTNYLKRCPALSSTDQTQRLLAYLAWPEGANTKGSILYSLHKRTNIAFCQDIVAKYCNTKYLGPDIFMLYHLLIRGRIVFSEAVLYEVTMRNIKHVGHSYKQGQFFGAHLFLILKKSLDLLWRREVFYYLVVKIIWQSDSPLLCVSYALYTILLRHLHALWAIITWPFKKIHV